MPDLTINEIENLRKELDKDMTITYNAVVGEKIPHKAISIVFGMNKTAKLYQTKIWKHAINSTTNCEKLLDNAGMICEPSTDSIRGRDDYQDSGELLFRYWRCNYVRESDGFAVPTALESDPTFKTSGDVDVGTLCCTFYYSYLDKGDHYLLTVSDSPNETWDLEPFPSAVREDGTVEPFFILSSYFAGDVNGKLRSQPNLAPSNFKSYSGLITEFAKKGSGYHGAGIERNTYQIIWTLIKYAQKSSQKVFTGCTNVNYQFAAAVSRTTNATYFPVTASQANSILVGDLVSVGYPTSLNGSAVNIDRGIPSMHQFVNKKVVLKKESLSDGNVAIYIDTNTGFPTADQTAISGQAAHVYISSMGQLTGVTDKVLSKYDGSWLSNTNSRNAYRIQGVEYANGYYFVPSDTVAEMKSDYTKDVYHCNRWATRSTADATIRLTYTKVGVIPYNSVGTNKYDDYWIGDIFIKNGASYPCTIGSSDQLGIGDRLYMGGNATSVFREYLLCGNLGSGSDAGSSNLNLWCGLGHASWHIVGAD